MVKLFGEVSDENIKQYEIPTHNMERYFLANHLVIGANRKGGFLMFNEDKATEPGEFEVVEYNYSSSVNARHPDFVSYLRSVIDTVEQRIASKRYR